MSEAVQTQNSAAQGFGAALKNAPLETVSKSGKENAGGGPKPLEPEAKADPNAVEPGKGTVATASAQPPKETETPNPEKKERAGLLGGIKAERLKRQQAEERAQAAERELAQMRGEEIVEQPRQTDQPQPADRRAMILSERLARQQHSDYDEKFAAFEAEALENPEVYRAATYADDPGEFAYQRGRNILLQKKYGSDVDSMLEAVRKEGAEAEKKRIEAERAQELTGKVHQKNNQPTDILAGGAAQTGDPKQPIIGFGQLLAKRRKG